jgi:hypothetical protein
MYQSILNSVMMLIIQIFVAILINLRACLSSIHLVGTSRIIPFLEQSNFELCIYLFQYHMSGNH